MEKHLNEAMQILEQAELTAPWIRIVRVEVSAALEQVTAAPAEPAAVIAAETQVPAAPAEPAAVIAAET